MRKNVAPVVLAGMLALSNIGITANENSIRSGGGGKNIYPQIDY